MCEATDGTTCPCSEAPSATPSRRTCATEGCTRIASGGAKHCRTCRAERPLREKSERMMSAMRAGGLDELDDDQVIGCVRARMLLWDDNELSMSGEILRRIAAEAGRDEALGALHRLAGVESMETKPGPEDCEALIRQELHERLQSFTAAREERDSATATVTQLTERVGVLELEQGSLSASLHEAREQRDAWMATSESGDAEADEMQETTDRLIREREEIRNTMNVARDHARGLEVRLKRAKEDRDASSREATSYREIAEAHRKIAERAADDLVASATSLDNAASDIATLRTRLHIMYAVAGLLAVAALVGGVL